MKVSARATSFEAIDIQEALEFVSANHRQGAARPGKNSRAYQLSWEGRPIAVAIFSNPRTAKMQRDYTTELFRMAFEGDTRIPGGASKLIKGFIRSEQPADLFTYQDGGGELTDVYSHAGLELISEASDKQILVRDGLTAETAENNWRDWLSIEQAVRRGPDALLGTVLGERFRSDGSRMSNLELFLEFCGYHLETVAGDRVYGWQNTAVSFYTYRLSSTVDDFYYLGRRMLRNADPSLDSCLTDGYWGSGGKAFKSWREGQRPGELTKEVLAIYGSWREAVAAEKRLVADLYLTDPLCLNATAGGTGIGKPSRAKGTLEICDTHGESLFFGGSCRKCAVSGSIELKLCDTHGETKHRAQSCFKCVASRSIAQSLCSIHGITAHRGDSCFKCSNQKAVSKGSCPVHGESAFVGDSCRSCAATAGLEIRNCRIHGSSIHFGDSCRSCVYDSFSELSTCAIHGESIHHGDSCLKCNSSNGYSTKSCKIHGESTHQGESCKRCDSEGAISMMICEVHGETKHRGSSCAKCTVESNVTISYCEIHGDTKHRGDQCYRCFNSSSTVAVCDTHGESSHTSKGLCRKCLAAPQLKDCEIHGESLHRGENCMKCLAANRKPRGSKSEGL